MGRLRLLLDTHSFVWAVSKPERLSPLAAGMILDPANQIFVSSVSIWEMAIKSNTGKLPLDPYPDVWIEQKIGAHDFTMLPISDEHIYRTFGLPLHHRDPFDRLLITQCISERMPLISSDKQMKLYPIEVIW